jgi:membrane-bound lytic murein transglycosylase D
MEMLPKIGFRWALGVGLLLTWTVFDAPVRPVHAQRLYLGQPLLSIETLEASRGEEEEGSPGTQEIRRDRTMSDQPATEELPWRYREFLARLSSLEAPVDASLDEDPTYNVPIVRNDSVEGHIRFFQIAIRDKFDQWLNRLSKYRPIVENIFSEFDLPSDLVFLSLVESGFNPHAYSRARATGPWQFMKRTAKLYGLRVDEYVDERRDPIKSSVAAARYLRDLYDLFGTWPLAMAAYNAGEGKVLRALQKTQSDSFWELARTRHLRKETKDYVPRFMAATIIARSPDRYGFTIEDPDPHQFEEVIVRRPVLLPALAAATGISFHELKRLNPELRRDMTPPHDSEYLLKVPVGTAPAVERALERLPAWKQPPSSHVKVKGPEKSQGRWYEVRTGDSLWLIAKRFKLSVRELKTRNPLTARTLKPGDRLLISP